MDGTSKLEIKLNWFDRFIGFVSPKALVGRRKAKLYNAYLARKYEASSVGRRTDGWNTSNLSANSEISAGVTRVRDRSRDLVRNNPYAARGIQVIANNVVGIGINTQIKVDTRADVSLREKKINNVWRSWANRNCDFEGVHTLAGLQRIAMRGVVESGEVFIRVRRTERRVVRGVDGKPVEIPPIQLQVLEADFVSNNRRAGRLENGNQLIQGIEIDEFGKKVAYHMFIAHPGSNDLMPASRFSTVRIPAEEVLHLYRMDRPGQLRGVPWLANVMLRLRDFDIYEDAQLKRQQCAAMFTAFIHDMEGFDDDSAEDKEEAEIGEKMEPGLIEVLGPGKSITLSKPPGADNYREYTSVVLHSIAGGLGITYESMTGDLADVSFSSARMGWLEMQRNFRSWGQNIMINQMLDPTFSWFGQGMELIGQNMAMARPVYTPPRREMIDPVKETAALKMAVRSGFKTQSDAIRELGHDPDNHYEEIEQDNKILDDKKIILDTDPRNIDNGGSLNEETDDTEEPLQITE